ncbi:DUF986 domain-containing protein [Edwardsiella ictaluri]|uniref:UPF0266 membrane protein NT01EI_1718 n=2 Tax=Edwardsiella ictaluri TaxID=67780 RepID=Y1718_EDWI9|nr:DUF986 family protein [Edwardsiella ictaluri]C5BDX6.1 RecName: Full=UPF0266 membrane protein NT01EI_1718 [Edwardsiella ictaluri 93-146]ACR68899.1 Protein of unknown function (DUF986) [Edwardsiella ictaluri 93-146]ARD38304.1 hypothetical protein B6E78_01765 [Edwardsiella ictaluri]AVZ80868.1 DUF986 domain-containing protein [Edwardsiella ictaluri]EKS7764386.1 DUF986 domain-containing protein [Edwardsiella ictaluri]EKS7771283.1 DUF986 domain-containing protein [Edwardsiella ictaluri]
MSLTDIALLVFIVLFLLYAIYDEAIMPRQRSATLLRVNLKRRNKADSLIFIGLLAILVYRNISDQGAPFTTWLLATLMVVAIYIFYLRWPKLLFKQQGFYYGNVFIDYARIRGMNLSEDGFLVIDLEKRRLLIQVANLDSLDEIFKFLLEHQQKPA